MVEHVTLTDPQLHEPKGVAAAVTGQVYRANGAGSGSWEKITGFGQYQDSRTTVGTPALNIATGVRTKFICNGGTLIKVDNPSDLSSPLWDTTTNKHVPIAEDDVYSFRVSFVAENYSGTSPSIEIELDIGGVPGVILDETKPLLRNGNAQSIIFSSTVFTGSTYIVNGGEFYLTYTGTGTCDIYKTNVMISRLTRKL